MPGSLSLDDFCARPHALVSFAGDLGGFMDEILEKVGRKRHVVLAVPQFNGLGSLLTGTDIIATVPDYTAEVLTAAGGLRAEDPPLEVQTFELHMAWRGSQDNDPGERWLRSRIQMFFGDLRVFRRRRAGCSSDHFCLSTNHGAPFTSGGLLNWGHI